MGKKVLKNFNIFWLFIFFLLFVGRITLIFAGDGCQINSDKNVHYVIIDPLGRKTGFDPITNKWYEEIPGANYGSSGVNENYSHEFGTSADNPPIEGLYQIKVIGVTHGKYSIGIYFLRGHKHITTNIEGVTDSSSVSYCQFTYNSNPDSAIKLERIVNSCSDIRQDLDLCYKIGWITNKDIYNSLSKKIDNAEKQADKGKSKTATNNLNAFINEVDAQRDKHITKDAAVILVEDAEALIRKW